MTIQSSGPLSIGDIATEFGGAAPFNLNNYYAGGPHVPSGTSGVNGAVPSSGPLSMSKFYGTSSIPPYTNVSVTANSVSGYAGGFSSTGAPETGVGATNTTPANGNGSYSFSWSYLSGDNGILIDSNTAQNPRWFKTLVAGQQQQTTTSAMWRVTCSDGISAATFDISVSLTYENLSG